MKTQKFVHHVFMFINFFNKTITVNLRIQIEIIIVTQIQSIKTFLINPLIIFNTNKNKTVLCINNYSKAKTRALIFTHKIIMLIHNQQIINSIINYMAKRR